MWANFGTPGKKDAAFKIWINNILTHDYPAGSGVGMLTNTDSSMNHTSLTPVWGGVANIYVPQGGMDQWYDDLILSTEPITGGILPEMPAEKQPNPPIIQDVR
jgi:hypothetical protein